MQFSLCNFEIIEGHKILNLKKISMRGASRLILEKFDSAAKDCKYERIKY